MSNQDVVFQVTDWAYFHEYEEDEDKNLIKQYVIRLHGITKDNKKTFVNVVGFLPYFYILVPDDWNDYKAKKMIEYLVKRCPDNLKESICGFDIERKSIFWEFNNYKLFTFMKITFYDYEGYRFVERVFWKKISIPGITHYIGESFQLFESNIEPMLRFMHIRGLNSCGWIKIARNDYTVYGEKISYSEINIKAKWNKLWPVADDGIAPMIIAAFDIECDSADGSFPQPKRDSVIQIGTTFSRYGEDECYYKHIVTLGDCDPINGVDVESYGDERRLLISWRNMILKTNPDIVTGYNIFGFDYKYLKLRAEYLGCESEFSELSCMIGERAPFIEKVLQSSALGVNELFYYSMTGRTQVDLMKVIQSVFKLESYKLDNVAADFIKEKINNVILNNCVKGNEDNEERQRISDCIIDEGCNDEKKVIGVVGSSTIVTSNTYGMAIGRYVKIYYNDGLSNNAYKGNKKFKIIDLTDTSITIDGVLDGEALEFSKYDVYWSQAKDDISPKDIFRLQKGSSKDRAIIAQYCLQDCELCNKLMNKLQILTNNIGMANVCHVPLSYIFLRGQGIKIFSLVAKKCRERNHLIPVIKKFDKTKTLQDLATVKTKGKKKEIDPDGYEGATVFEPHIGMHTDPISVLDFNSLYPNSMIYKNLSHECHVANDKYLGLVGYVYEETTFNNNDGTIERCIFAKAKNGIIGILPEILKELLDARARMRKLAGETEDKFRRKILDGLQLAYKMTANALYGQCGAKTSSISKKQIAAATTSIGRYMLNAAKIFVENIVPLIVFSVLSGSMQEYRARMELMFSKQIDKLLNQGAVDKLKEEDRLKYLCVFLDNKDDIDDAKFVNDKLKHKGKEDFILWIHREITGLLAEYSIEPKVIYGDTDSVFINFGIEHVGKVISGKEKVGISIELAKIVSMMLHKILPSPENMVYEKTFCPFIIVSKKRYVGNKYEMSPLKFYQDCMGLSIKRRDYAAIVKVVVGGIIRSMLNDPDKTSALEFVKRVLYDIFSGKYPIDKFILSKTLKSDYSNREAQVHAALADRMKKRDPGNAPQVNDRVQFAYIIVDGKVKLQNSRVEDPDYIVKNGLKLDYLFYLTNQIMKPSMQFLALITDNPIQVFESFILIESNRRKGLRPITYYLSICKDDAFDSDSDDDNVCVSKFNCFNDSNLEQLASKQKPSIKPRSYLKKIVKRNVNKGFDLDLDSDDEPDEPKPQPKSKSKTALKTIKPVNPKSCDTISFNSDSDDDTKTNNKVKYDPKRRLFKRGL